MVEEHHEETGMPQQAEKIPLSFMPYDIVKNQSLLNQNLEGIFYFNK